MEKALAYEIVINDVGKILGDSQDMLNNIQRDFLSLLPNNPKHTNLKIQLEIAAENEKKLYFARETLRHIIASYEQREEIDRLMSKDSASANI